MAKDLVQSQMLLPEVIRRFPATRAVFDRYGLQGCGGPMGPKETISWFSRLHNVPLDRLLREVNEAARVSQPERVSFHPALADTIYRPFFLAGLMTVLTLGCAWGAINLLMMGAGKSFDSVSYSWILAHANAMIFGFVGFFIMGFAYQAFPRFKHARLAHPRWAVASLPVMAAGILLQTLAHLMAPRSPFLALGLLAGLFQFLAVVIFVLVLNATFRRASRPESYDPFIYSALAWFLLAALCVPLLFWMLEGFSGLNRVLNIAVFDIPVRDIQLLGVAVVLILGVSLRYLPHAYGLREPPAAWRRFLFWGVNGALVLAVVGHVGATAFGRTAFHSLYEAAAVLLFIVALGTPLEFGLFRGGRPLERDRGLKFIRAAHLWFILAMGMLVLAPAYNGLVYGPLSGSPVAFSHAYFGAYRHALTVGFILMMIVGVSSKVVPTLNGVDLARSSSLGWTFALLNGGNLLRITTQISTDFTRALYPLMGISGFIELAGLALWAWELASNIRFGIRLERSDGDQWVRLEVELLPETRVAAILKAYPETLEVFLRFGFTPLANPALRRTLARVVTLEQAARREGVDLTSLLEALRRSIAPASLPGPRPTDGNHLIALQG